MLDSDNFSGENWCGKCDTFDKSEKEYQECHIFNIKNGG